MRRIPLSFGHGRQAEAPEGKADVLDVKGGRSFSARFFIDSKTHLPLMLSWTTPPNFVPVVAGQKPPANLPPGSVTYETPMPPPESATPEQKKQFEEDALAARKKARRILFKKRFLLISQPPVFVFTEPPEASGSSASRCSRTSRSLR